MRVPAFCPDASVAANERNKSGVSMLIGRMGLIVRASSLWQLQLVEVFLAFDGLPPPVVAEARILEKILDELLVLNDFGVTCRRMGDQSGIGRGKIGRFATSGDLGNKTEKKFF